MIARLLLIMAFVPSLAWGQQQEIATFLTYNILNYRNETSFCTSSNNSALAKEGYLKTIFQFADADLIAVNEIGANPSHSLKILDRCLNVDGETKYQMAPYRATSGSNLVNGFYYNGEMFTLKSSDVIDEELNGTKLVRLIDVYVLYYNDPNLALNADTTFLTVFVGHLKAGNSSSDASDRGAATAAVMDYISTNNISGNYIIAGDLNTYTNTEAAIQNLMNPTPSWRGFVDPVNRMGDWNNNGSYADVHTQSTHATSNGCASGGGMDDRFDFILMSEAMKEDSFNIEYVSNSYWAIGNDGNHFNESINNPPNNSVPANVLTALYEASDHLPVKMDVIMTEGTPNSISDFYHPDFDIRVQNPAHGVAQGRRSNADQELNLRLMDVSGKVLEQKRLMSGEEFFELSLPHPGIYLLQVTNHHGQAFIIKIIGT